jgi:hypothetical protein
LLANHGLMGTDFSVEYKAILNQAISLGYSLPSPQCQLNQNQLILSLKTIGVWSQLDLFYVGANDSSSVNFSLINWAAPSTFQLSRINNPSWTSSGWQGDGSTSYLNTGWNPSLNAVNYSIIPAFMGVYIKKNGTVGNGYLFGDRNSPGSGGFYTYLNVTNSGVAWNQNGAFAPRTASISIPDGTLVMVREHASAPPGSSGGSLFINGVDQVVSAPGIANGLVNAQLPILRTTPSAGGGWSNAIISLAFAGGNIAGNEANFYNAWNTYKIAIGL